jgi:Flp pilus assembly pilin Flp
MGITNPARQDLWTGGDIFLKIGLGQLDIQIVKCTAAKRLKRKSNSKSGQTLVEYALILAFISVGAIAVLIRLGNTIKSVFTTITSQLAVAGSSH